MQSTLNSVGLVTQVLQTWNMNTIMTL